MPIWLRTFHIQKISEYHKIQNEKMEKAKKGKNEQNPIQGPNITPADQFNFKK